LIEGATSFAVTAFGILPGHTGVLYVPKKVTAFPVTVLPSAFGLAFVSAQIYARIKATQVNGWITMFGLGTQELMLILVIALVLFGDRIGPRSPVAIEEAEIHVLAPRGERLRKIQLPVQPVMPAVVEHDRRSVLLVINLLDVQQRFPAPDAKHFRRLAGAGYGAQCRCRVVCGMARGTQQREQRGIHVAQIVVASEQSRGDAIAGVDHRLIIGRPHALDRQGPFASTELQRTVVL
jgi:hypothetical protein